MTEQDSPSFLWPPYGGYRHHYCTGKYCLLGDLDCKTWTCLTDAMKTTVTPNYGWPTERPGEWFTHCAFGIYRFKVWPPPSFLIGREKQAPPQGILSHWKITSKVKDAFSLWCVFLPSDQKINYVSLWLGRSPLRCPQLAVPIFPVCMTAEMLFSNLFKVQDWRQFSVSHFSYFSGLEHYLLLVYNTSMGGSMVLKAVPDAVSGHIVTNPR